MQATASTPSTTSPATPAALAVKQIKVTRGRLPFKYVDVCITAFQTGTTEIELSGIGSVTSSVADIADMMHAQQLAEIISVSTGTAQVGNNHALKGKLTVRLQRSAGFANALVKRNERQAEKQPKSPLVVKKE